MSQRPLLVIDGAELETLIAAAVRSATVDPRGPLIRLRDGWQGVRRSTLLRWVREQRLPAFEIERGALASWEADIRRCIEQTPARFDPAANDADPWAAVLPGRKVSSGTALSQADYRKQDDADGGKAA
jgi:hypothetical protein